MSAIAILLLGHGLTAALTFARNLILAQSLGLEDYSIAITLSVLLAAVELMTSIGIPQLCISHPKGGTPRMQAGLHGIQVLRGMAGALALLCLAGPLARVMGIPDYAIFFAASACIPLILGFGHLDMFRAQRHRRHIPHTLVLSVPAGISVGVVFVLGQDPSGPHALFLALVAQSLAAVALSHALARRRFALRWDSALLLATLRFGIPIAANGALLFSVLHLEKVIAGQTLGLHVLGLVAMGVTLTLTPHLIAAKSFQAYHLPRLRRIAKPSIWPLLAQASLAALLLSVCTYLAAVWALGQLDAQFLPIAPYLGLFVTLAALRLPKSAVSTLALAQARTGVPVWANLPRLIAAPLIWISLTRGGGIDTLLHLAIAGEAAGLVIGVLLCQSTQSRPGFHRTASAWNTV